MKKEKMWNLATAVLLLLAIVIASVLAYCPNFFNKDTSSTLYASSVFDKTKIMNINIIMDDNTWDDMLENAAKEEYYACDIEINGKTYYNVAIRPKGNTSLSSIVSDDTTDRFSFKVEFGHFQYGQTLDGLDKLSLNNIMSDSTYMKEYITYDILSHLGVNSSLYSFASINRNGEYWGLYLALEGMENSFQERNYGNATGKLYKPESIGGGGKDQSDKQVQSEEQKDVKKSTKDHGEQGFPEGGMGSALSYIDDNYDSYEEIWNSVIGGDITNSDKDRVIEALKHISAKEEVETYLDVDAMLRYIAANVFVGNGDSYFGSMLHNYYLYEKDGVLTMLPWDYNLAFGGFSMGVKGNGGATSIINQSIDDVVSSGTLEERPMLAAALSKEEYWEQYHKYLQDLLDGYFTNGTFETTVMQMKKLIAPYVKEDPTAFYTYDEFEKGLDTLVKLVNRRAESIQKQLDGTIPAKAADRKENEESLIDGSDLVLSDMGTFGRENGFGQKDDKTERKEDSADKEKEQDTSTQEQQEQVSTQTGEQQKQNTAVEKQDSEASSNKQMEPPEGMEPPQDGQGKMPEGMEPPQNGQGKMPEGMEPPQNGQGGMPPGMGGNAGNANQKKAMIWTGVSIAVLAAAYAFVVLFKRKKYRAK